jgi:hypothetical protein
MLFLLKPASVDASSTLARPMERPHLVILSEEYEPTIRGQCSSCPDVTFAVDRTAESYLLIIHQMFDAHFQRVHVSEDALNY